MLRKRPKPRKFRVIKSEGVTPNMHRITLGGEGIKGFPANQRGGYVKFMLPSTSGKKPILRTYTIRDQSGDGLEVDFALHGPGGSTGPATNWALSAQPGDMVMVGGPGPAKPLPAGQGPFLLVGDMTALPAISVNLEDLPDDAAGHAIILIRDESDKQVLTKPNGVTVEWVVEADQGGNPDLLDTHLRKVPDITEYAYAWVACEFEAMKGLRQYLRVEKQFGKDRLYISSYWKRGLIEDEHKQIKRADVESVR